MATQTRVYIAKIKAGDKIVRRLVRASHPSHVTAHVARDMIDVAIPSQDELIEAVNEQIAVETIKPEQAPLITE